MPCSSCGSSYNTLCSTCSSCSTCCSCTYHNVTCHSDTAACVDVAEFCTTTTPLELESCNAHTINIINNIPLTLTEFKKMFFADGNHFSLAPPPQCADTPDSIVESAWGKYIAPAYKAVADFSNNYSNTIDISQNSLIDYTYTRSDKFKDWIYVLDVSDNIYGWIPKSYVTPVIPTPRIVNFNKLGGKDNDPSGVDMSYRLLDPSSAPFVTFYAQKKILANMITDIGCHQSSWSLCSRASVFDELFNLAFVPTNFTNSCLHFTCGRSWKDIINALDDQTYVYDLSGGNNNIIFYWLPGDPSSNRFAENIFSASNLSVAGFLASNSINIISPGGNPSAAWNTTVWDYTVGGISGSPAWELQTNVLYSVVLDTSAVTLTLNGPINVGDMISLLIRIKIFNENCSIFPNIINIDYHVSVDKPLDSYCAC